MRIGAFAVVLRSKVGQIDVAGLQPPRSITEAEERALSARSGT